MFLCFIDNFQIWEGDEELTSPIIRTEVEENQMIRILEQIDREQAKEEKIADMRKARKVLKAR